MDANSQQTIHVSSSNKYSINYKKHEGQVILNNGQTISGTFQYDWWEFPEPNFRFFDKSGKPSKKYRTSEISSAAFLGSDTTLSNKDSTFFVQIGKPGIFRFNFFRQLTFGIIVLYDPLINVNERRGIVYDNLYTLEGGSLKKLHSRRNILNYIEGKLVEKGIARSFNSVEEAIKFLKDFE